MRQRVPTGSASQVCLEFRNQLQQVIACITPESYFHYITDAVENVERLVLTPPASVQDSGETLALSLSVSHVFEMFEDTKGNLVPSTKQYYYQIADPVGSLLRFENHPDVPNTLWPHVHVDRSGRSWDKAIGGLHIPTNRIALEQVVRFLHREFDIPYLPDENAALTTLSEIYKQHTLVRSWADEP